MAPNDSTLPHGRTMTAPMGVLSSQAPSVNIKIGLMLDLGPMVLGTAAITLALKSLQTQFFNDLRSSVSPSLIHFDIRF
eukprot:7793594-Karenia_brevis.AAC.1